MEGVHNISAEFSPSDEYILYYHGGRKTLKIFRVSDGTLVGTLRPHATLTSFACTKNGEKCLIGGEDGSLLTTWIVDIGDKESLQRLAKEPTREALARHLGVQTWKEDTVGERDPNIPAINLKTVGRAVNRFKALAKKNHKSSACTLQ